MSLSLPILLIIAALASVLGGSLLYFRKTWSEQSLLALVSIGGGLLFSLTILDMLPYSMGEHQSRMPFVLLGFACLFVIEALSKNDHEIGISSVIGITSGFLLHAFMEGVSMEASFQVNAQLGLSVFLALILHKIPDGISLASILLIATGKREIAFLGATALGIVTLLGAWVMDLVEKSFATVGVDLVFAIATGVFLYVSASHLVPLIQRKGGRNSSLFFFLAVLGYLILSLFFQGNNHTHV
ncbi:ZIP family metal transporter [Brevibacillus ginsengisoli]|uniref:ZIP family metal transporter n=1 Tax=Brevibacillus ginsengisoli TaxID=363854 RepID=UPI003CF80D56